MDPTGSQQRLPPFVAALGLAGATSGQESPKDKAPAERVEAPKPPEKPQETTKAEAPPADVRIPPKKPVAAEEQAASKQPQTNESVPFGTFADWVIVAFTGILTVVAVLQHRLESGLAADAEQQRADVKESIAIAKQSAEAATKGADAAERSADLARTAMVVTQRAAIVLADVVRNCTFDPAGKITGLSVRMVWKNTGNTSALHVQNVYGVTWDENAPSEYGDTSSPGATAVVGAGSPITTGFIEVRPDVLTSALAGETKLFVWGLIEYDDVFEGTPRHRTEYCAVMEVPAGPNMAPDFYHEGEFNGCESGCSRAPQTPKGPEPKI